jgi:4-amino-4-deoxy-L-arabinose transferase-like glycosyltransferase
LKQLSSRSEKVIITGLFLGAFLIHLFLQRSPFQSDESVYAYSAYAISKGVVPYVGIQLAHPPLMYLIIASIFSLFGPNLFVLRLAGSTTVLLTNVLIFAIARRSGWFHSRLLFPVLSVVIYSFIAFDNFSTSILEIFLTFFITLGTALYVLFVLPNGHRSRYALFLVGVLMGVSVMIKYTSLVFLATLFIFHSGRLILKKEYKRTFADALALFAGLAIPVMISLALIFFVWGAFRQFYIQSVYWQTVRWPTPLETRVSNILMYTLKFFPLLILAVIGTILLYKKEKSSRALFFSVIFISNMIGVMFAFSTFLVHYLNYLSPFLALLSAFGLVATSDFARHGAWSLKINKKNLARFLIFVTIMAMTVEVTAQATVARDHYDDSAHFSVGQYISQITKPDEMIWTSEGAIAFFAQRRVAPANSSDWPIQCSFTDIFAYDFDNYMGNAMKDYKNGVVSPENFIQSWESNKVKVIVIINGSDWVPYPDKLLLSGFLGYKGASEYLQEHYSLNQTFISENRTHSHEIWVRK